MKSPGTTSEARYMPKYGCAPGLALLKRAIADVVTRDDTLLSEICEVAEGHRRPYFFLICLILSLNSGGRESFSISSSASRYLYSARLLCLVSFLASISASRSKAHTTSSASKQKAVVEVALWRREDNGAIRHLRMRAQDLCYFLGEWDGAFFPIFRQKPVLWF